MERRTLNQIERDYRTVRRFVTEHPSIASIKELATGVALTESQVRTSLEKHPRVYEKIKALIDENTSIKRAEKAEQAAKKEAEKEALKAQKKAEHEAKKAKPEAKMESKSTATVIERVSEPHSQVSSEKTSEYPLTDNTRFLIDASITGAADMQSLIDKIKSIGLKIVLTSITIRELDQMQKYRDTDGIDARKLLNMAAKSDDFFECVNIDETVAETADDCIISYCVANKENIILVTSDKTMALKARSFGITTKFIDQNKKANTAKHSNPRISTLFIARRVGKKLYIHNYNDSDSRSVQVISKGMTYTEFGMYELKIGDDVYLATKKEDYLTFAHYNITTMELENNCNLIYSRRIYYSADISVLPNPSYQTFMLAFSRKVNFNR